jgi:hypothetical protein
MTLHKTQDTEKQEFFFYPHKLALTSSTTGGHWVGIVLSWTQATGFSFFFGMVF